MPTARESVASCVVDDKIYVLGGVPEAFDNPLTTNEHYDPSSDSWSIMASMASARAWMVAGTVNGKCYVIGGYDTDSGTTLGLVEEYDPASNSWRDRASMPTSRWDHASAVVGGLIYVFGGTDGFKIIHEVEVYDPAGDQWTTLGPMPAPPSLSINAGMNDAWYNPATHGQGLLIAVFPVIKQMFVAWFTYDAVRPPENVEAIVGEPGHRWLTAQGPYNGNKASLTIYVTEGGVLDAAEPPASNDGIGDGTMTIGFADCTHGLVTYEMTSPHVSGEIPIQRIVSDNVALCEALATE